MSSISGPTDLQPRKLQDDEKELVMGYGVEVVPGQKLPGCFSHIQHRELPPPPKEPNILGLRRVTFVLSIVLIAVLVAGGIAAGIEASTVAQCREETRNIISTPDEQGNGTLAIKTVTVTIAVPGSAPTVAGASPAPDDANKGTATTSGLVVPTGTLALNCPELDRAGQQTIRIGTYTWFFNSMCGTDFAGHEIVGIISYSLSNCIQACVMYNLFYGENNCVAVHFAADMVSALASNFVNYWLKNGTETNLSQRQGDLVITAFLANSSMVV